ncbi:MAG: amino acid dehydrogenase [Saprospiraceae bacterium]|nr:amino acid dehydrogenase [Saprospiraceae bacterium]
MLDQLDKYLKKPAEIVFEWNDSETDAVGWLVINSLKNGAAGGGTRMRPSLTKEEVISLAKVMELKFSVCGPSIGGAKSGINFNPNDPRKPEVLKRWFKAIKPLLKSYYGTGGDLNVDEVKEVFPMTREIGIIHPQEGVLEGYYQYNDEKKQVILRQLDQGCKLKVVSEKYSVDLKGNYTVADMITGFGVSESIRLYYEIILKEKLDQQKVLIQGWGNVASAAAFYLAKSGAKITGIVDKDNVIWYEKGLSVDEIRDLYISKNGNALQSSMMIPVEEFGEKIWNEKFDIFVPAAASRLLDLETLQKLINNGLSCISCGANVPFKENMIVFGDTSQIIDSKISLIPDFVANCGMARTFAYLMQNGIEISENAIFEDVSNLMRRTIEMLKSSENQKNNIMNYFLSLYLNN